MSKTISILGIKARKKAVDGMSIVADAVLQTVGPFGLNHGMEADRKITNDGYLIGNTITPTIEDEFERWGAETAGKNVAKVNTVIGDFTSFTWAFQNAIIKEAIRYLPNENSIKAKKTVSEIAQMIEKSKNEVLAELKEMAQPITTKEDLIKSALVSVEDEKLAEMLGSMQWELGADGRIIAEEVNELESSIEKVKGMRLDNGFGASIMVTNPAKQTLEIDKCPILLTNYVIGVDELQKLKDSIFKHLITSKKLAIVIVARAWTSDAIKKCQESAQAGFAIFPINAPYTNQVEMMHDMEAVVGGRFIATEESSFDDIYITDIGFVERLVARISDAVITGTDSKQANERVAKRVEVLKQKLIGEQSDFYKKMIQDRIAQLTNGFAILKVGSLNITNRQRLKDKADDAVNTVRFNLQGGVVKGAGQAMKEISDKMADDNILKRPLLVIYNQIISSAPEDYVIPEWVKDSYLGLKFAIECACDFASVFASVNGISTTANKKECYCNQNNQNQDE